MFRLGHGRTRAQTAGIYTCSDSWFCHMRQIPVVLNISCLISLNVIKSWIFTRCIITQVYSHTQHCPIACRPLSYLSTYSAFLRGDQEIRSTHGIGENAFRTVWHVVAAALTFACVVYVSLAIEDARSLPKHMLVSTRKAKVRSRVLKFCDNVHTNNRLHPSHELHLCLPIVRSFRKLICFTVHRACTYTPEPRSLQPSQFILSSMV